MNENIDLTKILKDCPKGTALWSDNYGKVWFLSIEERYYYAKPIVTRRNDGDTASYTKEGWQSIHFPASCLLWPSKEIRDWSNAPWLKENIFDPKALKPFDRVLARNHDSQKWTCDLFSNIIDGNECMYHCINSYHRYCIPYNDDTKHLVGTEEEAPDFYKYWED